jgi:two-component system, chemotaxis family, chemotaxis protein CheY
VTPMILVVDDEDLVRIQIGASLEFDGFRIAQAANGSEALDWLLHNKADVMLTDILMPGKGGIDTIQDAHKLHPDMKIIAMSGRVRTEAVDFLEAARQYGADRILFKPFGRTQLLALVRELLADPDSP